MSLNSRYPPSLTQTGPSAGPRSPPNPLASSLMGSDVEMILSSAGSYCSMRLAACADARSKPVSARPPVAADMASMCHRDACDHVCLFARQLGKALGEKADSLAHRNLHGLLKVRVEAHDDPVGRGLGARPGKFEVLAHDELKASAQAGLDGGKIDFALALGPMAVADGKQAARRIDRHEKR